MSMIAEDLLLLLLDDETGKSITDSTRLPRALAGAAVLELALAGNVRVTEKGENIRRGRLVTVRGAKILTDPTLTRVYETLAAAKPMRPQSAIEKLQKGLRDELLARLEKAGKVRRVSRKVLGMFPKTDWPVTDRRYKDELRTRVRRALTSHTTPPEREAALISLLSAVDVVHKIYPDADKKEIRKRAKEIAAGEWAGKAVRAAVDSVNAAVFTAVMVATTAGAASS